jgi:2-keto-3-deoxy-L-rhamnonate aldolase RhmA
VPLVRDAKETAAIVKATRFPSSGTRSFGPVRAGRYGLDNEDYFRRANDQVVVVLILETLEALDNLEEIAAVDGVDALYVGPYDLSLSLGIDPFRAGFSELEPIVRRALDVCRKCGVSLGMPVRTPGELLQRRDQGFTFLGFGPDYALLADAAKAANAAFREVPFTASKSGDDDRSRTS